eukprot:TRINITY_DN12052_c0_g1_i1.p1 TRINITY_DN12052_c0_g1~~TRINITY_DN12052_c0_g1_i1.p1  ORF type:complete len:396 (-),score=71.72 TRINITY_DN12052_c0_g1_i1:1006-2193(-)
MYQNNGININSSAATAALLAQQSSQHSSLSSSPVLPAMNQVSQALAMSLLNDGFVGNGNSNAQLLDTWELANKAVANMIPSLTQVVPSPRGHNLSRMQSNPSTIQNPVLAQPSLLNFQQQSTATNTLINDLQLLNLRNNLLNSLNPQIPPYSTSNIGSSVFQSNKLREQNPRKIRQQEQFRSNKERTIYISEVHPDVTEADIAILFSRCGDVVDCRLCGDAHSKMRFAFVEFSLETWTFAVPEALKLNNSLLCGAPIRVQRSKTAIVPIKKDLLPQTEEEMVRCARTIYACNIDKRFSKGDIQTFFETLAVDESVGADGRVNRLKLKADSNQKTVIALVEFCSDESAASALNKCQGALMGCLPLRVSPSKTAIRTPEEERALREARYPNMFSNFN